jgi:hypothetical protein
MTSTSPPESFLVCARHRLAVTGYRPHKGGSYVYIAEGRNIAQGLCLERITGITAVRTVCADHDDGSARRYTVFDASYILDQAREQGSQWTPHPDYDVRFFRVSDPAPAPFYLRRAEKDVRVDLSTDADWQRMHGHGGGTGAHKFSMMSYTPTSELGYEGLTKSRPLLAAIAAWGADDVLVVAATAARG